MASHFASSVDVRTISNLSFIIQQTNTVTGSNCLYFPALSNRDQTYRVQPSFIDILHGSEHLYLFTSLPLNTETVCPTDHHLTLDYSTSM